ncbi:MAG: glucoamylase family protein [Candidatus Omnitrophota bacterium]
MLGILIFSSPVTAQEPFAGPEALLEEVQKSAFRFFEEHHHPHTGLVRDSAPNRPGTVSNAPASIAGVGFALTIYPVAVERGWMSRTSAHALTVRTLEFFLDHAAQYKGFFYHFLDFETGERMNGSELSPIDTALFLAGALFAAEYYDDPEVRDLVQKIYERVDFPWMLNKGKTFALAWSPETGFSKARWDHFDECLLLYVLAIGSPTHPVSEETWRGILRTAGSYRDYRLIQMPPLFVHQYPHVWLDLRGQNDGFADYFENSVNASRANRAFCIDQASKFSGYGPDLWGLSASEGPTGYRAYGAPPGWTVFHDGTVAPAACGSSIVFTPEESIACLENIRTSYSDAMWGPYGFSDAMNVGKGWFSDKVLAIDQGPLLLMIENYRTGLIWKFMSQSVPVRAALEKTGFRKGALPLPWPEPPVYQAPYVSPGIQVDGFLRDWPPGETLVMNPEGHKDFGDFDGPNANQSKRSGDWGRPNYHDGKEIKSVDGPGDFGAKIRFAWDNEYLYFVAKVDDDDVVASRTGQHIWRDDLLEIYIDPEGDGLFWNDPRDFQLGFRPGRDDRELAAWSWFQGGEDPREGKKVYAKSYTDAKGYIIEGAIRWDFLEVTPEPGKEIRLSPAVHEVDRKGGDGKLVWFFRNEEKYQRFVLGRIVLVQGKEIRNADAPKRKI